MKSMLLLFIGFIAMSSSAMNMEIVIKNNTDNDVIITPKSNELTASKIWYRGTAIKSEILNKHEQLRLFVTLDEKAGPDAMLKISSSSDNYANVIFERIVGFGGCVFVPKLIECYECNPSLKYNATQSFDCCSKTHVMTISR